MKTFKEVMGNVRSCKAELIALKEKVSSVPELNELNVLALELIDILEQLEYRRNMLYED